jgi:hypothetical protein
MWWPFRKRIKPAPRPQRYPRTVDELYRDYQHVIRIDPSHIPWSRKDAFEEIRRWAVQHGCGIVVDRVLWDQWRGRWKSNGIGGEDLAFFGTNDESVATWAQLRWG